ncbi:Hybrid signal transduction protein like [Quillaja saponaria]|uniref:Hybrid signal transduction protein like n=1 Tax=Quillaja saponaria TaxID=32244 RepID=A0AAD7LJB6_QUISA|nr:Hybrid signal transduction protein like [Quillaja saponaria]
MEFANRIANAAIRAANNNTVINVCLVGSFIALSVRSVNQQNYIASLEAEKESLTKSNKAMKKSMWDWKQQLFAEAETESAVVPLSRLKVIYGEAPAAQLGETVPQAANSSGASKFVV